MILCGYKTLSIRGHMMMIGVGITYIRNGEAVEFLEGWINPSVEPLLTDAERTTAIYVAKKELIDRIRLYLRNHVEHERSWEGVTYG